MEADKNDVTALVKTKVSLLSMPDEKGEIKRVVVEWVFF